MLIGWERNLEFFTKGMSISPRPAYCGDGPLYFFLPDQIRRCYPGGERLCAMLGALSIMSPNWANSVTWLPGLPVWRPLHGLDQPVAKRLPRPPSLSPGRFPLALGNIVTLRNTADAPQGCDVRSSAGKGLLIAGATAQERVLSLRPSPGFGMPEGIIFPPVEECSFTQRPIGTRATPLSPSGAGGVRRRTQGLFWKRSIFGSAERVGGFWRWDDWGDLPVPWGTAATGLCATPLDLASYAVLDESTERSSMWPMRPSSIAAPGTRTYVSVGHRPVCLPYTDKGLEIRGEETGGLCPQPEFHVVHFHMLDIGIALIKTYLMS